MTAVVVFPDKKCSRGFTLVELLIVIAIIAILAAIALPQLSQYQERAVRSAMTADARNVASLLETDYISSQIYPNIAVAPGQQYLVGTVAAKMSRGSSLNVVGGLNTYTITVSNASGGTGFGTYTLNNTGTSAWH